MIRFHVDAVLRVLDGFTGKPPSPSAIHLFVDGTAYRPIVKDGGYYVLKGLVPGEHQLVLQGAFYQDERLTVTVGAGYQELLVTMKPGTRYPFGRSITTLTVKVQDKKGPLPNQRVWISAKNSLAELKIAQDGVKAGDEAARLFCSEVTKSMPIPCDLMLMDAGKCEIIRLEDLEEGRFASPLRFDHKRGCPLYPVQIYTAGESGRIRAVFREPSSVELLVEGAEKSVSLELTAGENEYVLTLGKK